MEIDISEKGDFLTLNWIARIPVSSSLFPVSASAVRGQSTVAIVLAIVKTIIDTT